MTTHGGRRGAWGVVGLTLAFATLAPLTTGCSKDVDDALGYTPTTLAVDDLRAKTKSVSSQIYDMIGIKGGKTTEPGPGISTCEEDPEHLVLSRHPWSLYDVPEDELKQGFQRLREELPKRGWKIVEYGPNKSAAKTLELTADSTTERYSVNAELHVGGPASETPKILVYVVSGCFRAPEGTDLNGVY